MPTINYNIRTTKDDLTIELYKTVNAAELRDIADVLDKYDEILSISIAESMGMPVDDVLTEYFDGKDHLFTAEDFSLF